MTSFIYTRISIKRTDGPAPKSLVVGGVVLVAVAREGPAGHRGVAEGGEIVGIVRRDVGAHA